jgi:restriction system protein
MLQTRTAIAADQAPPSGADEHGPRGLSPRVWYFRPQRDGDFGRLLVESGLITAEFGVRADLSEHYEAGQILDAVTEANPNESRSRIRSMSTQLNALVNEMQPGDLAFCALPGEAGFGIGQVGPGLAEDPDGRPARSVRWLREPVPRGAVLPDLLTVTASYVPLTEVTRPGILDRMRGLIRDGRDPGPTAPPLTGPSSLETLIAAEASRIRDRIGAVFTGHAMAELTGELLRAQGLRVQVGAPGPDGGVDLIAGGGPLGLAPPRLVGQVKSGLQVAGDETLQALIGNLHGSGADAALIVSWSGLTRQARARAQAMGFRVRVWDAEEILHLFLEHQDRLPERVRSLVRVEARTVHRLIA